MNIDVGKYIKDVKDIKDKKYEKNEDEPSVKKTRRSVHKIRAFTVEATIEMSELCKKYGTTLEEAHVSIKKWHRAAFILDYGDPTLNYYYHTKIWHGQNIGYSLVPNGFKIAVNTDKNIFIGEVSYDLEKPRNRNIYIFHLVKNNEIVKTSERREYPSTAFNDVRTRTKFHRSTGLEKKSNRSNGKELMGVLYDSVQIKLKEKFMSRDVSDSAKIFHREWLETVDILIKNSEKKDREAKEAIGAVENQGWSLLKERESYYIVEDDSEPVYDPIHDIFDD